MPTEPPEHWIKIAPGGPLRDTRIVEVSPSMRNAPLSLRVDCVYHVGPGVKPSILTGAILARVFGERQEAYRLDVDRPPARKCYRLGRRFFIWD